MKTAKKKSDRILARIYMPKPIRLEGRPELLLFPEKIILYGNGGEQERTADKIAVYIPDLFSLGWGPDADKLQMRYLSVWDPECWIVLTAGQGGSYFEAEKFLRGEDVGGAFGPSWKVFLAQLGLLPVDPGEKCGVQD